MKKYIFILISLCISIFSAWSVWEGNGIAGTATDFSEDGMFVKSSLFPKYSLIEIVNLENDIKVRAIVLEGKDIPGILMSFSPSVAEALKVQYGKVTRIRISSPSLTSDDVASSLYLPKEKAPKAEPEKTPLASSEKKDEEPKKADEKKNDDEKEVVLYDFNPIAKISEKVERKDGAVSFDPAFIEEDVKLDLHIPDTPVVEKKEESLPTRKEEIIEPVVIRKETPIKEVVELSKTEVTTTNVVEPPKTVATPLKPIYLESTSLRPPKEVPPIVAVETKLKNDEPVKDVVMIEKKKAEEPRLFIKVDEVKPIKEVANEESRVGFSKVDEVEGIKEGKIEQDKLEKIEPVLVVKDTEKKPAEKLQALEKVPEATQIKVPFEEEKKIEIADVGEVEIPKQIKEEKDVVLPSVIELAQIVHAPDEKDEVVQPVITVDIPQKPEEREEVKEEEVPIVDSVILVEEPPKNEELSEDEQEVEELIEEENPMEEEPTVEEPIEEENPTEEEPTVEEPIEEENPTEEEPSTEGDSLEAQLSEEGLIEEEPKESEKIEEVQEEFEQVIRVNNLDEMPLTEVEVKNKNNDIEEEPSKDSSTFQKEKDIKALDEYVPSEKPEENPTEEIVKKEIKEEIEEKKDEVSQKEDEPKLEEVIVEKQAESTEEMKPVEELEPNKLLEPTEESNLIEEVKPIEEPEQAEELKPSEQTKLIEDNKPIEEAKQIEMESVQEKNISSILTKDVEDEDAIESMATIRSENLKQEKKESFSIGNTFKSANYVQVAVYSNALAVEDLLKKYSKQYPITVEKKEDISGVKYVVCVGPLKKDEIGAIQERFKSFGFKDCFLK